MSRLLVELWILWGGRWKLPGAGLLIKAFRNVLPGLKAYRLEIPGVGIATLDFRDVAAFGILKVFRLHDFGNDAALFALLEKVLPPGAVLWDVGANVGFVSGYFAQPRFQLKAIHSFEPNPRIYPGLQKLFKDSTFVHVHPFGLGSADANLQMNVKGEDSLVGSLTQQLEGADKIEIKIRSGESVRRETGVLLPDVIKIDVEGYEPEVLLGLKQIITEIRPVIIFEHIWLTDEQVRALIPTGYDLLFLHDDGTINPDMQNRRKGHDAILSPTEKTQSLKML